jgi:hypothetical protein
VTSAGAFSALAWQESHDALTYNDRA